MSAAQWAARLEEIAAEIRASVEPTTQEPTPAPVPEPTLDDELYQVAGDPAIWRVKGGERWHIDGAEWAELGYALPLPVDRAVLERVPIRGAPPKPDPIPLRGGPVYGINVQPSSADRALEKVLDLGLRHVRTSVHYDTAESELRWIRAYRDAGVEVLPIIAPHPRTGDFTYRAKWFIDHFGIRKGDPIQLGNEHDNEHTAHAEGGTLWGTLTAKASGAIREAGGIVVAHGLGWTQPGVHAYLGTLIQAVAGHVDVMSLHSYGTNPTWEPMGRVQWFRRYGWSGPMWGTEIGLRGPDSREFLTAHYGRPPTEEESFRYQAEVWGDILTHPDRTLYERIYLFQLTPDQEWARAHGTHHYTSILNEDWSPRPAYHTLREAVRTGRVRA